MNRVQLASAAFVILLAAPRSDLAAAKGEITVLTGQESGDYGTESDTDRQSATVRLVYGDKTRLRLDFGVVRSSSALGIAQTPFGTVPTRGGRRSQGSNGVGGNGIGPVGGAGDSTTTTDDSSPLPAAADWVTGPGDLRLTLSRQLIGGGASLFRLDVEVGAKVPTANEEDSLGTGEWDHRIGVAAQYRFWSVTGFGGLGWNSLGDPDWVELNDVLDAFVGLETEPLAERVVLSGWLESNEEVVAGTGSRTALGIGIRTAGRLRWQAQIRAGLSQAAEDISALFGFSFGVSTPTIGSRKVG